MFPSSDSLFWRLPTDEFEGLDNRLNNPVRGFPVMHQLKHQSKLYEGLAQRYQLKLNLLFCDKLGVILNVGRQIFPSGTSLNPRPARLAKALGLIRKRHPYREQGAQKLV